MAWPHLWVDGLGQVCAVLAEAAAGYNLVAEVQQVQGLIHTVSVEGIAPELLWIQNRTTTTTTEAW
jgi:hypothetical protein